MWLQRVSKSVAKVIKSQQTQSDTFYRHDLFMKNEYWLLKTPLQIECGGLIQDLW